ncbi:hypothetical protein TNCV_3830611 [Trichonephila clavipes]|nr:hypothetical protein TNCV_3830611 [Trichonephila clavipes]
MADQDIVEFGQSSKYIVDVDSDGEKETNYEMPDLMSSKMRNIMKWQNQSHIRTQERLRIDIRKRLTTANSANSGTFWRNSVYDEIVATFLLSSIRFQFIAATLWSGSEQCALDLRPKRYEKKLCARASKIVDKYSLDILLWDTKHFCFINVIGVGPSFPLKNAASVPSSGLALRTDRLGGYGLQTCLYAR